MKYLSSAVIIVISGALSTTLLWRAELFGAYANLLLAYTVFTSLKYGPVYGGGCGLACGIAADVLSAGAFGFNSLTFMYSGVVCGILCEDFFCNNFAVTAIFSFLCCLLHDVLYFIFARYIWHPSGFIHIFATKILISAVLTSVTAVIFYIVSSGLERKKMRKGKRRRYGF